ncbi:MAG: hypothetical protein WCP82_07110 [Alphaproteobacteria bacterium]
MTLASFTDWLSNTTPSNVIRDVTWIIPVVQSIHIILIAIVISSTTMFNVRLLQLGPNAESPARMAHRVFPWVWWSLLGLLLSGSLLITGEPVRELLSPAFAFKIVVILLVATRRITTILKANAGLRSSRTGSPVIKSEPDNSSPNNDHQTQGKTRCAIRAGDSALGPSCSSLTLNIVVDEMTIAIRMIWML